MEDKMDNRYKLIFRDSGGVRGDITPKRLEEEAGAGSEWKVVQVEVDKSSLTAGVCVPVYFWALLERVGSA
jgi:hypothetical protein